MVGLVTHATLSHVGFAQASAVSGGAVPVGILGIMYVAWKAATVGSSTPVTTQHLQNRAVDAGYMNSMANANNTATDTAFGVWLDTDAGAAAGSLHRAHVFGPKSISAPS